MNAQNINYINETDYKKIDEIIIDTSKMLMGLQRSLKTNN